MVSVMSSLLWELATLACFVCWQHSMLVGLATLTHSLSHTTLSLSPAHGRLLHPAVNLTSIIIRPSNNLLRAIDTRNRGLFTRAPPQPHLVPHNHIGDPDVITAYVIKANVINTCT